MIVGSDFKYKVGEIFRRDGLNVFNPQTGKLEFHNSPFMVIREATLEEYLKALKAKGAKPSRSNYDGCFFYEISVD